jgi:hypothetical protein
MVVLGSVVRVEALRNRGLPSHKYCRLPQFKTCEIHVSLDFAGVSEYLNPRPPAAGLWPALKGFPRFDTNPIAYLAGFIKSRRFRDFWRVRYSSGKIKSLANLPVSRSQICKSSFDPLNAATFPLGEN